LKTSRVTLSLWPGTVELWTLHTPSAKLSCWPVFSRQSWRSSPGSSFCARLAKRSSPPSSRWRNSALYHSTVSPESTAAGWDRDSRLYWVLEFSKLPPATQRASQLRSRQRNTHMPMPHSTTSTASTGQYAGR